MKTTTKRWAAGIVAIVLAGSATGFALVGPDGRMGDRRGARAYRAALGRVGLSREQRDTIRTIISAERPNLEALRAKQQTSKAELDAALQAPNPDPAVVGGALLRTRADRQALRAELRKVREQTVSVLTPEQKAKLDGYLDGLRAMRRRGGA